MSDSLATKNVQTVNLDPEVKAYVFQVLSEFEPFITENTVLAVVAKDPLKLFTTRALDEPDLKKEDFENLYRIAIVLQEDDSKIEEEALHSDVYEAIRLAKEKLLKNLSEIQDEVISQKDRNAQINFAKANIVH